MENSSPHTPILAMKKWILLQQTCGWTPLNKHISAREAGQPLLENNNNNNNNSK